MPGLVPGINVPGLRSGPSNSGPQRDPVGMGGVDP